MADPVTEAGPSEEFEFEDEIPSEKNADLIMGVSDLMLGSVQCH